jgi:CRP/FNR family transcriptional regulator, cyclic AMP receptor protein
MAGVQDCRSSSQVSGQTAEQYLQMILRPGYALAPLGVAIMSSLDRSDRAFGGLSAMPKVELSLLEKSNLIESTQWANEFSYPQVKKLAAYMDVYQVPKETLLFYEGDKTAYLVLIVKGQIHVVKFDSQRKPKRIATLSTGKTIGEMTIIDGEPRSASAITATDATLMVMTVDRFDQMINEWPRVSVILILKIAKMMSQYLRQTSGRLIDYMGD